LTFKNVWIQKRFNLLENFAVSVEKCVGCYFVNTEIAGSHQRVDVLDPGFGLV
jgi:hypothetical protein